MNTERNKPPTSYVFNGVRQAVTGKSPCVLFVAGGTGGHVFPAIAVATLLQERGFKIHWLGTPDSFEQNQCAQYDFTFHHFIMSGVRGKGIVGWLPLLFRLPRALFVARRKMRQLKPNCVVAMGGYVCVPAGLAAWLLGIPLVIHEQNAKAGLSNRVLGRFADRICLAWPNELSALPTSVQTGNPLRRSFTPIEHPKSRLQQRTGRFRLLIIGGSLGAQVLNETVPKALQLLSSADIQPEVWHQTGAEKLQSTTAAYRQAGVDARIEAFIDEISEAYAWADLIICRAGALTISEISLVGLASILVPYPHAVDDHQTKNAQYLATSGAAQLLPQADMSPSELADRLKKLFGDRRQLVTMASRARAASEPEATEKVVAIIQEIRSA